LTGQHSPGTPDGARLRFFDVPLVNNGSRVAFTGLLWVGFGGGVTNSNDGAVWSRDAGSGLVLVAREGGQAPDIDAGAVFNLFANAVLNDLGEVGYRAGLKFGLGGVDLSNDRGVWQDQGFGGTGGAADF